MFDNCMPLLLLPCNFSYLCIIILWEKYILISRIDRTEYSRGVCLQLFPTFSIIVWHRVFFSVILIWLLVLINGGASVLCCYDYHAIKAVCNPWRFWAALCSNVADTTRHSTSRLAVQFRRNLQGCFSSFDYALPSSSLSRLTWNDSPLFSVKGLFRRCFKTWYYHLELLSGPELWFGSDFRNVQMRAVSACLASTSVNSY